jgi:GT2 family glycosyltransferase
MSPQTAVSVVIPCHTERSWDLLTRAVASVRRQSSPPAQIVVAVDHNPTLSARARQQLSGVTVLDNQYQPGASGNRNTGASHTRTPIITFLDGDIDADPQWLTRLVEPFAQPVVVGTGGAIEPAWEQPRPAWFPDEFLWAVGGAYTGLPTRTAPVRNVWSASMAVRRDVFESVGGFRAGFGKLGDRARPEDTDLCVRMSRASGGQWMYVPDAVVRHPVAAERTSYRFFLGRCFAEGRGKAELAQLTDLRSLGAEGDYLRRTVPAGIARDLRATLRGQGARHATRAGAMATGLASAGLGAAIATAQSLWRHPRRPASRPVVLGADQVNSS